MSSPWLPVPPPSYGGTEAVVDRLARGLKEAGAEVVLFTTGDSEVPVAKAHVFEEAVPEQMGQSVVELTHVAHGYEALADCDVVHDHTLSGPIWALAHGHTRVAVTCHGPLNGDLHDIYAAYGRRMPLIAISQNQSDNAPEIPVAKVIHHGLDTDLFPPGEGDGEYLLFLGRMSPDKGVHQAIHVARDAGWPLKIAAKMREPAEKAYFTKVVEPLLGGDIEYVGEAANDDKLKLLACANALLNPIQWPEPFGLVMAEALACGTPVVGCPAGAAPEIVDHGVTGFLCEEHDALVDAVGRIAELDRRDCRQAVEDRFSTRRMVADHLALYEEMMSC
jgi:glycosyltransferase involved in cell wall biosynthesis